MGGSLSPVSSSSSSRRLIRRFRATTRPATTAISSTATTTAMTIHSVSVLTRPPCHAPTHRFARHPDPSVTDRSRALQQRTRGLRVHEGPAAPRIRCSPRPLPRPRRATPDVAGLQRPAKCPDALRRHPWPVAPAGGARSRPADRAASRARRGAAADDRLHAPPRQPAEAHRRPRRAEPDLARCARPARCPEPLRRRLRPGLTRLGPGHAPPTEPRPARRTRCRARPDERAIPATRAGVHHRPRRAGPGLARLARPAR